MNLHLAVVEGLVCPSDPRWFIEVRNQTKGDSNDSNEEQGTRNLTQNRHTKHGPDLYTGLGVGRGTDSSVRSWSGRGPCLWNLQLTPPGRISLAILGRLETLCPLVVLWGYMWYWTCYGPLGTSITGAKAWFALPGVSQTCSWWLLESSRATLCAHNVLRHAEGVYLYSIQFRDLTKHFHV